MIEAKKIKNIIYSPELVSRLLHRFLSGAQVVSDRGIKFEMIYFLLPIVMNDTLRLSIQNVNKSSRFNKSILSKSNAIESMLLDLYVTETKDMALKGMLYLSVSQSVSIGSFIRVDKEIDYSSTKKILTEYYRAAYYLGMMLAKEDYKSVFLKTKVKSL